VERELVMATALIVVAAERMRRYGKWTGTSTETHGDFGRKSDRFAIQSLSGVAEE
jgi:hypothetical protein